MRKKKFKEAEGYDADLQAAYDYYKVYSQSTADRFLAAYEEAIRIVCSSPYVCRPRPNGWRQMVIHRYPVYSVFYREFDRFWLLAGIIPTVQDPDSIQALLLIREIRETEG